jgi:hypothetical protein
MRTLVATVAACFALSACSLDSECMYCGTWRSDEKRTLVEMERSTSLTSEQRAFYESGFFGRLTVEMKPLESRAYFEDEEPGSWDPMVVSAHDGRSVTLRSRDPQSGEERVHVLDFHDGCYRVELGHGLEFAEWFCQVRKP